MAEGPAPRLLDRQTSEGCETDTGEALMLTDIRSGIFWG